MLRSLFRGALLCAVLLAGHPLHAATPAPTLAPPDLVGELLRERLDALGSGQPVTVEGETLIAARSLGKLYELHGYRPYWDATRLQSLVELLADIEDDGLRPSDYHFAPLQRLRTLRNPTALERVALELLASDAYALIVYHLYFGKVDPVSLDSNWNFDTRDIRDVDPVRFVHEAIRGNRIRSSIELVRPTHWMYQAGREALAAYRHIAVLGGWPTIPGGPTLKPGMSDARVALLRRRLAISGDLAAVGASSAPRAGSAEDFFDTQLEAALRHAQRRHRLAVDGTLGPATLQALNVPVEQRISQLRVNLERGRQVLHEIKDGDLVIVDIAGFEVHFVRDRKRIWQSRAVVGKQFRETPVFKASINNVVINPTWTVPPGILEKDILPSLRRGDRSILARKNLQVLDRNGAPVNAAAIDFSRYTARNFPYLLRQAAGPTNALGSVKINFPNPHLVYLHDTPSKSLFDETNRTFSSGCIRTERPLELAEWVLSDPARWNSATLRSAVDSGETRTLRVAKPVPVLLIYWTADRDDDGSIVFKPDPYGRDGRELAALDSPFKLGKRPRL
jgi:murein L,D-transpeptidase YcbB/YkuD